MVEKNIQNNETVLEVDDLVVHYNTEEGVAEAVNGMSFTLHKGETLGLVGETGAGKTSVALAIMGLLPVPPSQIIRGSIKLNGEELVGKKNKEMRSIRGDKIGMIFQDPMTSLNPVMSVGDQIAEVIRLHENISKGEASVKAGKMLEKVGIAADRYKEYPHQFSGGMKQRVVIAIALACNPNILIADEPTTALDVTIQAQVLELINDLKKDYGTSVILITHDLGVVAETCDRCAVVYAGEIVESGSLEDIFLHAQHPYTKGLFGSIPRLDVIVERLHPIKGLMSDPMTLPEYCSFYDRCDRACEECKQGEPACMEVSPGHIVRCRLAHPEAMKPESWEKGQA